MDQKYHSVYQLLGLQPNDDWTTAKGKFRKLVQRHHPDRYEGDETAQGLALTKFHEINKAFELLQNYYTAHQRLPLSPAPLSDREFAVNQQQLLKQSRARNFRKRGAKKRHKSSVNKLSLVIGIVIVVFLIYNSREKVAGPEHFEGVIRSHNPIEPSGTTANTWQNENLLGSNNGASFGEMLDQRLSETRP